MNYLSCFVFFFLIFLSMRASAEADQLLMEVFSEEELIEMGGYGEEKLSTVLITGSVFCSESSCLQQLPASQPRLSSWPLSGAIVGVYCYNKTSNILESNSTRPNGEFTIDLPSHVHAIPDLETRCWVELLRVPDASLCRPAYVTLKKHITISSIRDGTRTYDAGTIKLLHSASKPSASSCTEKDVVVEPTSH